MSQLQKHQEKKRKKTLTLLVIPKLFSGYTRSLFVFFQFIYLFIYLFILSISGQAVPLITPVISGQLFFTYLVHIAL